MHHAPFSGYALPDSFPAMPRVPKPKNPRTKHHFREWRLFRNLTQEQAIERLGWSQSKLSRIESGTTPYSETDLYAAAEAYNCTLVDLIEVNPLVDGEVIDLTRILRSASPEQRRLAMDVVERIVGSKRR
jgi:transcriptional regulator with XRE-family HTH domain